MKNLLSLLISCCALHIVSISQTTIPVRPGPVEEGYFGPTKMIVKLDPVSGIPIGNVPFDRYFILRIYFLEAGHIPKRFT